MSQLPIDPVTAPLSQLPIDRVTAPLSELRVLDCTTGIAGAYCTKLLADSGADVIKVESSDGDPLRQWSATGRLGADGDADGALFRFLHTSKRSILARPAPLAALIAGATHVIRNLDGPPVQQIHSINPRAVVVSISPFGTAGPFAHLPATEFTLHGWSGSMSGRGTEDRPPLAPGGRPGEFIGGTAAALGALSAWRRAHMTGQGDHVDVSLMEAMILTHTTYPSIVAALTNDFTTTRTVEIPSIEPAADGWIGFCTVTAEQWKTLAAMIGHPDMGEDPRYSNAMVRYPNRGEVLSILHEYTRARTIDEMIELAAAMRIPVAPIGNGEVLPTIDHFVARGTYVPNPLGGFPQPGRPFRLSAAPAVPFAPAPRLHEHAGAAWRERPAPESSASTSPASTSSGPESLPDPTRPLSGLKIADFTAFWAGPFACHYLAMMGADVVHVEAIQRPDGMRFSSTQPPTVDQWWEWGSVFLGANTNKRGVTIDLRQEAGREVVRRLIEWADVVIENFSPRVMDGFGFDADAVMAIKPDVIYVRMPAFGLDGPWRDRVGFAQTMEQISGMAWVTGHVDDQPRIPRGPCDPLAGMHAVMATLVALEHRRRTGQGQVAEVSMVEAALNIAAEQVAEFAAYGELLTREGNRGPAGAPQNVYAANSPDGHEHWIAVACADDEQWAALKGVMGSPSWAEDEAFATHASRRTHHDQLDERLGEWLGQRTVDDALSMLLEGGIPAAPVRDMRRFSECPQLAARRFEQPVTHAVVGTIAQPGLCYVIDHGPFEWHRRPAPLLGEHNVETLYELGYRDDEINNLEAAEVIGRRPKGL